MRNRRAAYDAVLVEDGGNGGGAEEIARRYAGAVSGSRSAAEFAGLGDMRAAGAALAALAAAKGSSPSSSTSSAASSPPSPVASFGRSARIIRSSAAA